MFRSWFGAKIKIYYKHQQLHWVLFCDEVKTIIVNSALNPEFSIKLEIDDGAR